MQSKIEALESQLVQAKETNHNHSFADAERLTEVKYRPSGPMFEGFFKDLN